MDLALQTLSQVFRDGLDSLSMAAAKSYIQGQFATRLETEDQIAGALADLAFYGMKRDELEDYLARVAAARQGDVVRALRRVYPPTKDLVLVFVGNAAKIRAVVGKYGAVTEMKITEPLLSRFR